MLSVSASFPSCVVAQYNPKELGVDKSVPWFAEPALPEAGSRRFMDYTDDACKATAHGVIESISQKYTMFLPDGTPCDALMLHGDFSTFGSNLA